MPTLVFTFLLVACVALTANAAEQKRGEFSGAKETVYPDWFKASFLEFEEDIAEAAADGRRVMLFFHQDGCPYCNEFVEKNLSQKDIVDEMQAKLDVIELNIWGDRDLVSVGGKTFNEKTFAAALQVQFTPTIMFLDEQGQVALRLNGYIPPNEFKLSLDYVNNHREKQSNYAEFLQAKYLPTEKESIKIRPYFAKPPHDFSKYPGNKPIAVFFEQGGCPNCDHLHEDALDHPLTDALLQQFRNVQIDIWSNKFIVTPDGRSISQREWSKQLNIKYAPTIVFMNAGGKEVIRSEAFFHKFHTQSLFDYVASAAYKTESNFQSYISARSEHFIEQGIDVSIWE